MQIKCSRLSQYALIMESVNYNVKQDFSPSKTCLSKIFPRANIEHLMVLSAIQHLRVENQENREAKLNAEIIIRM